MKLYQSLGILGTMALVSLIGQPVEAANTEIIKIKSEATEQSLQLTLDGVENGQTIPEITTFKQGKTLIASLPNVSLKLEQNFTKKNPYPGITQISVNQGINNQLQIKVTGEKEAPQDSILLQQNGDLILGFTTENNQLLAQNTSEKSPTETKNNDVLIPNPTVLIDGQPASPDNNVPQFLPKAVAPPVGDIAVSNINSSPATLTFEANIPVRRLVLKDAPVREVLGLLARSAGYNLIFTSQVSDTQKETTDQKEATISLDIDEEPIQDVFNSVLLVSGFQANLKGNTIFVGKNLPQDARNVITRTLRLNQVASASAAAFLATQGASVQRLVIPVEEITDPVTQRVVRRIEKPATLEALQVKLTEGQGTPPPLLLRGMTVTTDDRLNSVTLVGEPRQVEMATSFLTQLDARRRQVAVNLKIIDVNLANQDIFNSSVSFGIGDGFFVSDNGAAALNYGGINPPNRNTMTDGVFSQPIIGNPLNTIGGGEGDIFLDPQDAPFSDVKRANGVPYARPGFGANDNPFQPGVQEIDEQGKITYALPSFFQYPTKFLALIEAQVVSGNAKILTDPTLMVQEGQEATVKLVQEVITSVKTEVDRESNTRTITPEIGEAGLSVTVNVDRIDDNGFINLSVSPKVAAIGRQENFDSGDANNTIALLNVREISSGTIRLRDGQTLILSGVIQEQDKTSVTKVPILGDIPLLGALFRSTNRENTRNEVIVLLTPQIIDDSSQATWGYNYTPGPGTSEVLKKQGFRVPGPKK